MIIGLVHVSIVTVMFMLNFVHCEFTACESDNKQSLILSYLNNNNNKNATVYKVL